MEAEIALDMSVKARHVGESKNCWKYELAEPMKGIVYIPKDKLPQPVPEINVAAFSA